MDVEPLNSAPHDRALLVDLIPRRNALVSLFAGACGVIALLEALYLGMPLLAPLTTDGRVATFDLDSEGSLAVWFSTVTLIYAACATLFVARQRRLEAPHGMAWRLWTFAAGCWLMMSIDECASVHEAFKEMMSHGTGERLYGDGTIWWVLAYAAVLGATGIGIAWSLRRSPAALGCLLATAACYAVAALAELGLIMPQKNVPGIMLEEGCEMLGNVLLAMSMTLEARRATSRNIATEPCRGKSSARGANLGAQVRAAIPQPIAAQPHLKGRG